MAERQRIWVYVSHLFLDSLQIPFVFPPLETFQQFGGFCFCASAIFGFPFVYSRGCQRWIYVILVSVSEMKHLAESVVISRHLVGVFSRKR